MGSTDVEAGDGGVNEKPLHLATVTPFYMAQTEVTVAQYRKCWNSGGCGEPANTKGCNWTREVQDKEDHPINCVVWEEAKTYCAWAQARLPTEEEWEYAARGGNSQRSGSVYPFGDTGTNEQACVNRGFAPCDGGPCSLGTCKVGTYPPTLRGSDQVAPAKGLYDLAGNVLEWTATEYRDSYAAGAMLYQDMAVLRGASFLYDFRTTRASIRAHYPKRTLLNDGQIIGFRCVRD